MPSRQTTDGVFRDIVHPIDQPTRKMFEEAIISKYNRYMCKK